MGNNIDILVHITGNGNVVVKVADEKEAKLLEKHGYACGSIVCFKETSNPGKEVENLVGLLRANSGERRRIGVVDMRTLATNIIQV